MPTVILPDKICPHCGGTRWYAVNNKHYNKLGELREYTSYQCYARRRELENQDKLLNPQKYRDKSKRSKDKVRHTEEYKSKNRERAISWYIKNREKAMAARKKYYTENLEKCKECLKKSSRLHVKKMGNSYLRELIVESTPGLSAKDIPIELVEIKRSQLTLTRQLKTQKHGNS